jgi:hypothetical protein
MTALASGSSEAPRTCALTLSSTAAAMTTTTARRESRVVNGATPADTARRSRPAAGGPLDQAGLGPGPDTRHRTRWVVIVLCTNRRGGAVLRDQCPCMHACISPRSAVAREPGHWPRSPNNMIILVRHGRQEAYHCCAAAHEMCTACCVCNLLWAHRFCTYLPPPCIFKPVHTISYVA